MALKKYKRGVKPSPTRSQRDLFLTHGKKSRYKMASNFFWNPPKQKSVSTTGFFRRNTRKGMKIRKSSFMNKLPASKRTKYSLLRRRFNRDISYNIRKFM